METAIALTGVALVAVVGLQGIEAALTKRAALRGRRENQQGS